MSEVANVIGFLVAAGMFSAVMLFLILTSISGAPKGIGRPLKAINVCLRVAWLAGIVGLGYWFSS